MKKSAAILLLSLLSLPLPSNAHPKSRTKACPPPSRHHQCLQNQKKTSPYTPKKKYQSTSKKRSSPHSPKILQQISYQGDGYSLSLPDNWQAITDKSQLPEKLDFLFIGKGISTLTPTINVASEVSHLSDQEYINEVLSYHRKDPNTFSSTNFSTVRAQNCLFFIIKTDKNSSWGKVVFLQAISVKNQHAYLLNCMTAWDDFPSISQEFLRIVTSFKLDPDRDISSNEILERALKSLETTNSMQ